MKCQQCKKEMEGRKRKFCSDKCRMDWHNEARRLAYENSNNVFELLREASDALVSDIESIAYTDCVDLIDKDVNENLVKRIEVVLNERSKPLGV